MAGAKAFTEAVVPRMAELGVELPPEIGNKVLLSICVGWIQILTAMHAEMNSERTLH